MNIVYYELFILGPLGLLLFLLILFKFFKKRDKLNTYNLILSIFIFIFLGLFHSSDYKENPRLINSLSILELYLNLFPIVALIIDIRLNKKQNKIQKFKKYILYAILFFGTLGISSYIGHKISDYSSSKCDKYLSTKGNYCKYIPPTYR